MVTRRRLYHCTTTAALLFKIKAPYFDLITKEKKSAIVATSLDKKDLLRRWNNFIFWPFSSFSPIFSSKWKGNGKMKEKYKSFDIFAF